MSDLLDTARQLLRDIRSGPKWHANSISTQYERNELHEITPAAPRWCPVCGDDATTEILGRDFCDRHAPTTPTRRALLEACDQYQELHHRLDAMQGAGEWESHRALLPDYFGTGRQVRALSAAARREAGDE